MACRLQWQKQLPDSGWSAEAACHRGTGGRGPSGYLEEGRVNAGRMKRWVTAGASLLRRLEAAHTECRRFREENTRLRQEIARAGRQVARAVGEQRQTGGVNPSSQPPF